MNLLKLGEELDAPAQDLYRQVEDLVGEENYMAFLDAISGVSDMYLASHWDPEMEERLNSLISRAPGVIRDVLTEYVSKNHPSGRVVAPPESQSHEAALEYAMSSSKNFFEAREEILSLVIEKLRKPCFLFRRD